MKGISSLLVDLGDRIDDVAALDRAAEPVLGIANKLLPRGAVKDFLHGTWLGHPLHPLLTDLPIGFWTGAFVLDLYPGRRMRPAADAMVALGVATAIPTIAAGVADWSELNHREQRSGLVHAIANITATGLFAASSVARLRKRRVKGVALAMAGSAAATLGGYLGGHLTFRRGAGVNQNAINRNAGVERPRDWAVVAAAADVPTSGSIVVDVEGQAVLIARVDGQPAAIGARCSHLGGPLGEGEVADTCVTCPWHGSRFRLLDGGVERGPATAPQPRYDARAEAGKILLK